MSNSNYSFEQWCIDNNHKDYLERWDDSLNQKMPREVSFQSNVKYYFKCPRGLHESEPIRLYDVVGGKNSCKCYKCNSFAQFIIDNYSEEYLALIWRKENQIAPWDVSSHNKKKFWFNCDKDPDHVFQCSLGHYAHGNKCPYCSHQKIHPKDSLGMMSPQVLDIWSEKNSKSPYEYAPVSGHKVWWKCENGFHEDYERKIAGSKTQMFMCPECKRANYSRDKEDLTDQTFGELTPLYIDYAKTRRTQKTQWVCRCSCGNYTTSSLCNLKGGISTTCGNRAIHYSGENNGNWQGGITPENYKERITPEYNNWKRSVYSKDYYTCQCCGKSNPNMLSAHHILNFAKYKELRCDINNGISLCFECHSSNVKGSFHNTYGTLNNTPEQLEEYINNRRKELGIDIFFTLEEYLEGNCLKPNDERKNHVT